MPEKKLSANQPLVHSVVRGSIRADILASQTNNGFRFLHFVLGRHFVSQSSKKDSHSTSFFADNQDDLIQTILDASAWIREQSNRAPVSEQSTEA